MAIHTANGIRRPVNHTAAIQVRRTVIKDRRIVCSHRSTDIRVMISTVVQEKNDAKPFIIASIIRLLSVTFKRINTFAT